MVRPIAVVAGGVGMAAIAAIIMAAPAEPVGAPPPVILGTTTAPVLVAPRVSAKSALVTATSTASLKGVVSPNGFLTTYWFEYSADPRLGAVLAKSTPRIALATTSGQVAVEVSVADLMPSTTYYYRLVAESPGGVVRSEPLSFLSR